MNLTPVFIELTLDACLKAFWRKNALKRFLRQHYIKESILSKLSGETKREFLYWLFDKLAQDKDKKGHGIILIISKSLVKMKHFPDLENWPDSQEKITSAEKSILRLKRELNQLDQKRDESAERDRLRQLTREQQEKTIAHRQSLEKLYNQLVELVPEQGTKEGGLKFERWFYDLSVFFELESRPPYYAGGRQVDPEPASNRILSIF